MAKQKVESCFCPLTNKICAGGEVRWGTTTKNCVFRVTDTIPSGQCGLFRAIARLEKLDQIATGLNAIAQGKK